MIVEFWTSNYAPGMVQARIVNRRTLRAVLREVKANGGPTEEDTALLSHDDAVDILGPRYKGIDDGVRVRLDAETARNLYGYQ